jgi:polysaccharide biosynthesis/export protein
MNRSLLLAIPLLTLASLAFAQQRVTAADVPAESKPYVTPQPAAGATAQLPQAQPDYVLGAGDQLTLVVPDLEDEFTDKTFRIDMSGDISLPHAGRVHAAGLTTAALEQEINQRLGRLLKNPEATISLAAFGSQPVSVLGAVNSPGIRQLEGRKTLFEVLSLAGGLRPDAGYLIKITRDLKWGLIPLPDAQADPNGQSSTASVRVKTIIDASNAADNIMILPGDTISVPRADLVYAVGDVVKPGGFLLNEHESLSALQVVSLAEGLHKTAAADKARILRAVPGSPARTEIAVNLKQLMSGKGTDVQLQANDILFIPNSAAKSAGFRTLDAIVNAATGMAVYGRY